MVDRHPWRRRGEGTATPPRGWRTGKRLAPLQGLHLVGQPLASLEWAAQELAERMGTTKSVISRIESGQHRSGTDTLRRLAEALGGHAVIGFDVGSTASSSRTSYASRSL